MAGLRPTSVHDARGVPPPLRRVGAALLALALALAGHVVLAGGAAADTFDYAFTGVVTDDDTGDPLAEICVVAQRWDDDLEAWVVLDDDLTGADGSYDLAFTHDEAFTEVTFYDCDDDRHEALAAYVPLTAFVEPADAVVDFSLPAGAYAFITPVAPTGAELTGCTAGWAAEDPAFDREQHVDDQILVGPLFDDPFILGVTDCVDADNPAARYLPTWYPGVTDVFEAETVQLVVGDPAEVEIELVPGGLLAGTVTDPDGDLLECVGIYERRDGLRTATSIRVFPDDESFAYLTELGEVTLEVNACFLGDETEPPQTWPYEVSFYDGADAIEEATTLAVEHGTDLDDLLVEMVRLPEELLRACPPDLDLPFDDVDPESVHADSIACVVFREVARGVAENLYDPGRAVTRGQMATFVAQALDAAGFGLPAPFDQGLTDVDGVHADAINQLVGAGIVQGTTETTFSPGTLVRRAQMATFLVGAVEWALFEELEPQAGPHFTDTENNAHEANIDVAFELGLTAGIGDGQFGPAMTVRRAPMASFLTNLLDHLWPDYASG